MQCCWPPTCDADDGDDGDGDDGDDGDGGGDVGQWPPVDSNLMVMMMMTNTMMVVVMTVMLMTFDQSLLPSILHLFEEPIKPEDILV